MAGEKRINDFTNGLIILAILVGCLGIPLAFIVRYSATENAGVSEGAIRVPVERPVGVQDFFPDATYTIVGDPEAIPGVSLRKVIIQNDEEDGASKFVLLVPPEFVGRKGDKIQPVKIEYYMNDWKFVSILLYAEKTK